MFLMFAMFNAAPKHPLGQRPSLSRACALIGCIGLSCLSVVACTGADSSTPGATPKDAEVSPAAGIQPAGAIQPTQPAEGPAKDGELQAHTPGEQEPAELRDRVLQKFGAPCRLERSCGELLGVDCNAAADGPYYYVRRDDLSEVAKCGGACMMRQPCTGCPPADWECAAY